jgi:hypothetical protein
MGHGIMAHLAHCWRISAPPICLRFGYVQLSDRSRLNHFAATNMAVNLVMN